MKELFNRGFTRIFTDSRSVQIRADPWHSICYRNIRVSPFWLGGPGTGLAEGLDHRGRKTILGNFGEKRQNLEIRGGLQIKSSLQFLG
jgi:hypothetical protein